MKEFIKSINIKKAFAIALSFCFIMSTLSFFSIANIAHGSGLVVGESTTISKAGAINNDCGVPWINEVVFRVGILRDPDTYVQMKNGVSLVKNKFQQKIPRNYDNTLFMVSRTLYNGIENDFGKVTLGWYASGTKTLHTEGKSEFLGRIKAMNDVNPTSFGTNGVYYNALKSYDLTTLSKLANGKWKTLLQTESQTTCLNAWSYIFQRDKSSSTQAYNIEDRLHLFLQDSDLDTDNVINWSPAQKLKHKLRMLDLLMVCYNLMPSNATYRSQWESAIEDWITGSNLTQKPVTIVIDDAVAVNPGKPDRTKTGVILLGAIDYLNYVGGVETKFCLNGLTPSLVNPIAVNKPGTDRTYDNITGSVAQSIAASPTFDRIASTLNPRNGFSFGRAVLTKYRLSTANNIVSWRNTTVVASYIDVLHVLDVNKSHQDVSGFMFVLSAPVGNLGMNIKVQATPDNYALAPNQKTVGNAVKIVLENKLTDAQLSMIKPLTALAKSQNKSINVKYNITRAYNTGAAQTVYLTPQQKTYSANAFLQFVQNGGEIFTDASVASMEVPYSDANKNPLMKFTYKITMTVTIEGKTITSTGQDTASFQGRQANDTFQYVSTPSTYAEIKEGSPYHETFEAMAGVPSTEKLYFSAGGSEFIAEIQTEMVQNAAATRTYHSYYTGTDCEYKARDTAGTYTVGGNSVNAHTGGTTTKSWSGSIPWTGTASASGWHGGGVTNSWDYSAQKAALAEAQAWATQVNGTVISHTAASDGKTRTFSSWGASVNGGYTNGTPATWTDGKDPVPAVPSSGTPGKPGYDPGKPAEPGVAATCTQGSAGSYSYTVTGTVPAHAICGPCCEHTLPAINDTWSQKIAFDHLRVKSVHIWKIDQASVDGMTEITGTDQIKASIIQGDPNIFYNIAATETSADGRLRYTVEPRQHDAVTWNEGTRTNHCNGLGSNGVSSGSGHSSSWADGILYNNTSYPNVANYEVTNSDAKDKSTAEYAKFKSRRETLNTATVVSDMVILQTSSGDQSLIYFTKNSNTVQTQVNFDKVNTTGAETWTNNPYSAAKWSINQIYTGSYNGNYASPTTKYEGNGTGTRVSTIFDNDPAGSITRPARTSSKLLLYENGISQIETNPNKSYITGDAETFWKSILDYPSKDGALHDNSWQDKYGAYGFVAPATYSSNNAKVNDIIVHDPVSAQDAIVVGIDSARDQRSTMPIGSAVDTLDDQNKLAVCPRDPGLCEFRVLHCTYFQDTVLAQFNFEDGLVNSITGDEYDLPSGFTIDKTNRFGTGNSLSAKGTRWSIPLSDLNLTYSKNLKLFIEANVNIPVPTGTGTMLASFNQYDLYLPAGTSTPTWNTGNGWERRADTSITSKNIKLGMVFDFNNLDDSKLYINGVEQTNYTRINGSESITAELIGDTLNIGCWGLDSNYPANFYMDNLKIVRLAGSSTHTDACYQTVTFHPNGLNAHVHTADCLSVNGINTGFNYVQGLLDKSPVDVQGLKDSLGDAYSYVFTEPLLYTWNWSGTDTKGFDGTNSATVSVNGNKLLFTITGNDPQSEIPVNIDADAISSMKIYYDNNTISNVGQLFYRTSSSSYAEGNSTRYSMTPNTASQIATINMSKASGWAGTIVGLRYDFSSASSGNVQISKIELYGYGTVTNSGGISNKTYEFGYTGGAQSLTIPGSGKYKVELWGAQGGGIPGGNSNATGGYGGYVSGDLALIGGQVVNIYVGGQGGDSPSSHIDGGGTGGHGGYNGGGTGSGSRGAGGGGATDIRLSTDASLNGRLLVAGGGGGGFRHDSTEDGGETSNLYTLGYGENGCYSRHSSSYANDEGGGGGGYYGGRTAHGDDPSYGFGGSNYVSGSCTNTSSQIGVRTGSGYARITSYFTPLTIAYKSPFTKSGSDTFSYTGTIQQFTAPANGVYTIEVAGAEGGNATSYSYDTGKGATLKGDFTLNKGQVLYIVIGGQGGGGTYAGGGGGGTYVYKDSSNPLIIAGGGGGEGASGGAGYNASASTSANGYYAYGPSTVGYGGQGYSTSGWGGSGAGWLSNGYDHSNGGGTYGYPGACPSNGSAGGAGYNVSYGYTGNGGFGGGGGGGSWGAGAGGGYTGGSTGGGGAGSYNVGTNQSSTVGHTGNGYATISWTGTDNTDMDAIRDAMMAHYTLIPDTLPNGVANPVWACQNILGVSSTVGDSFEDAPAKIGSRVYDVTYPGTSGTKRTIRLDGGYNTPLIYTASLDLKANTDYILEFDYWSDTDGNRFDVDLWPDDLPQIIPTANKAVQHYKWEFSSGSTNMSNAILRIFNDVSNPNPSNIYVTNIKLIEKSYYNIHICDSACYTGKVLVCNEPHHYGLHYDGSNPICWEACYNDANHAYYKPTVKTIKGENIPNGTFINMDYGFQIYFPNIGDFNDGQCYGIPTLTSQRGKGYVDNMDTTKWTKTKRVKFEFNVINKADGQLYLAGEWIDLPVNQTYYDFYCVLANYEAKSASVQFEVTAINAPGSNDNTVSETNKNRYSDYTALHGGLKNAYIDIVGRIGNLVIDDSGDYRFCNFFKVPTNSDKWIVEGVVKDVNADLQNMYFGAKTDIRGITASASTGWLNTYGTQAWLSKAPTNLPLSPEKNNIPTLRTQPLRPGYDILADVSTIGDYQTKMQIVPYYYAFDLTKSTLTPVDVYMSTNGEYKPINIYDVVHEGWDSSSIYPYVMNLDWVAESGRRNYDILEKGHTDYLAQLYSELIKTPDADGDLVVTGTREMDRPVGSYYALGTAQVLSPSGRARTFIGSEYTNGIYKNTGDRIDSADWWYAAQRWHFKLGLPSSAVFVEHGKAANQENIDKISDANHVILMTADIQAVGDTFVLRYNQDSDNGTIKLGGKTYNMPTNIPPVLAIYSAEYTARQDVDIRGTH